ncbi:MAG: hypothetical protein L0Y74_10280 [candidate division Zixibacteria bacterium]|nr:hypothetical protein [candidate division Zixibacteria bacterium]
MTQALVFSILVASVFLNLALYLSRLTAKLAQVNAGLPAEVKKEPERGLWDVLQSIVQAELWEVVMPVLVYSIIYPYLPFSGIRAGLFLGLVIFVAGILPQTISLSNSLKIGANLWLHQLIWRLVKLLLIFGTFGYFFN